MTAIYDALVIGGGISGLAAAHRLQTLLPGGSILLVEAESRLGGVIRTERIRGFTVEAGPDSFLAAKPRGLGLCQELGMAHDLEGPDPANRRTYVLHDGRLEPIPEGLSGLVPARLEPLMESALFSKTGKERMQHETEIAVRQADDDETLAAFIVRRFGQEVYDHLIEPLMAGIYAGDGRELSLRATFPQLHDLERLHGSILRGLAAAASPASGRPGFLTPRNGMQAIVDRLHQLGRVQILLDTGAQGVEPFPSGYRVHLADGRAIESQVVVVAAPARAAAALLNSVDPVFEHELGAIPYASTATISLAFPASSVPHPLNGYGYVVPRIEQRPVLASTWVSSKWRYRSPPDCALIRLFVGRFGQDSLVMADDAAIMEVARDELRTVLGIVDPPLFGRIYRWPLTMPQYTLGHGDRLRRLDEAQIRWPGLALAGSAYRGVGIPDCILSGEQAAERVVNALQVGQRKAPTV